MSLARTGLGIAVAVVVVVGIGAAVAAVTLPENPWWGRYLKEAQQVSLADGSRVELYCEGQGRPIVIFDAGLGDGAWTWRNVQDQVAQKRRTCVYSRPGYGRSTPARGPRDTRAIVRDLDNLIVAARLEGPFVLVGHSMASFDVRLFAFRHPDTVAGIVLVDPSGDWQMRRFASVAPLRVKADLAEYADQKACRDNERTPALVKKCVTPAPPGTPAEALAPFAAWQGRESYRTMFAEWDALRGQDNQELVTARRSLGSMPLVVLTAKQTFKNLPPDELGRVRATWSAMHDEIARLSTVGVNRQVDNSSHYIQNDQPAQVIGAVDQVIDAARVRARDRSHRPASVSASSGHASRLPD